MVLKGCQWDKTNIVVTTDKRNSKAEKRIYFCMPKLSILKC